MKKALFSILMVVGIVGSVASQVYVDRKILGKKDYSSKVTIIPMSSKIPNEIRSKYEEVFEKYWKISDFKIVDFEEYAKYEGDEEYTFFDPVHTILESSNGESHELKFLYYGWAQSTRKGQGLVKEHFGFISLYMNIQLFGIINETPISTISLYDYVYADKFDEILNLSPGLLKLYIEVLQNDLENLKTPREDEFVDKQEVVKLKNATLNVPHFATQDVNSYTGKRSETVPEKLFKDYEYSYKILDMGALSEMILKSTDPIYILLYGRDFAGDYIGVFDASKGRVLYNMDDAVSYTSHLKSKDIKKIAKAVSK